MFNRSVVCTSLLALALTFGAGPSLATPDDAAPKTASSTDWSDIWWNPAESGWGMQLVQEAGTVFATLFIYGPDNEPTWLIGVLTLSGGGSLTGPVYKTTGPWFGVPFNPNVSSYRQVGTMAFSATTIATAQLAYTVDGVAVSKSIQRQTVTTDDYNGAYFVAANITQSSCNNPADNNASTVASAVTVTQTTNGMSVFWDFGGGETCSYGGNYTQLGKMGLFTGTYSCSTGETGTMSFIEMTNRVGMISGRLTGHSDTFGCNYSGRFTGINPSIP